MPRQATCAAWRRTAPCASLTPSWKEEGICIHLDGEIFEDGEGNNKDVKEIKIGKVLAWLILRGRAMNEHRNVGEVMDAVSSGLHECWGELLTHDGDWTPAVLQIYDEDLFGNDILFLESIELDDAYRGKGIGARVVRETISTFGSSCALVACKPFPLQYTNWMDDEYKAVREAPGFEKKRRAAFGKVEKFWRGLHFNKLPNSEFFTYAPQLKEQPSRINIAPKTRAATS
jgi:GNAT superfamily N-acetyltransferase